MASLERSGAQDWRRTWEETFAGRPDGGRVALDPDRYPELYDGVIGKRVAAFLADAALLVVLTALAAVIFGILGVLSFGLLWPGLGLLAPVLWLAYFTVTIGGRHSASPGMRAAGIEIRTWDGARPGYVQGALQSVMFYVTAIVISVFVLIVPFFNKRRRCLHDYLIGTVVINAPDRTRPRATVTPA